VVIEFGVYVCSTCSGIHREMNHKGVKGVSMSNFTDKDVEFLLTKGNEVNNQSQLIGRSKGINGRL
jgi:Putative GTPase activating protein for Arf